MHFGNLLHPEASLQDLPEPGQQNLQASQSGDLSGCLSETAQDALSLKTDEVGALKISVHMDSLH